MAETPSERSEWPWYAKPAGAATREAQREAGSTEWGTTYAYELRTLLPACSYLVDAHAQSAQLARTAAHAVRVGHLDEDALQFCCATCGSAPAALSHDLRELYPHMVREFGLEEERPDPCLVQPAPQTPPDDRALPQSVPA
jgi:hypothetical protein